MEHAPAEGGGKAIFGPEPAGEDQCADGLHADAANEHHPLEPDHAVHLVQRQGLGHNHSLTKPHLPPKQKDHQRGGGHEAQAANLNQAEQYHLAEAAPLGIAVEGGKPGDTGGGGGGKQGVQKGAGLPVSGCGGKHQQQRTQADDGKEGHRNQLGATHELSPPPHTQRQNSLIQGQGRLPFPWMVIGSQHAHFGTMVFIIKPLYQFFKTIFLNILFCQLPTTQNAANIAFPSAQNPTEDYSRCIQNQYSKASHPEPQN